MDREGALPTLVAAILVAALPGAARAQVFELTTRVPGSPPVPIPSGIPRPRGTSVAKRLATGYTTKGWLVFAFGPDGFLHRYPIANLSTGGAISFQIERRGGVFLALGPGMTSLSETPQSSPWLAPFGRFALLGRKTLDAGEGLDVSPSGVFTASDGGVPTRVVWKTAGDRVEITAHSLPPLGTCVVLGRAVVKADRSEGALTRTLGSTLLGEDRFRRTGPAPAMVTGFDIPLDTVVVDERVTRNGRAASYPWPGTASEPRRGRGHLQARARALPRGRRMGRGRRTGHLACS